MNLMIASSKYNIWDYMPKVRIHGYGCKHLNIDSGRASIAAKFFTQDSCVIKTRNIV